MAYADKFLQTHHVVQALCPDVSDVARLGDIVSMKNYDHVTVLFSFGAINAGVDADITFYACSNVAGDNATQITPISYRQILTGADQWSTASEITNGTIDVVSNGHVDEDEDCCTVAVEFDAADIYNASTTAGLDLDCFQVRMSAPGPTSTLELGVNYILYPGCRYASRQMPSAIID